MNRVKLWTPIFIILLYEVSKVWLNNGTTTTTTTRSYIKGGTLWWIISQHPHLSYTRERRNSISQYWLWGIVVFCPISFFSYCSNNIRIIHVCTHTLSIFYTWVPPWSTKSEFTGEVFPLPSFYIASFTKSPLCFPGHESVTRCLCRRIH